MDDRSSQVLGCGAMILFIGFGLVQLAAGWIGIEHTFGWGWGIAAIVAAIFFRFTIPIVIGGFLCAKNIWEWHWVFAALFAAPGLLFMVPAFIATLVAAAKR
jgi:hypothetical protein